MTCVLTGIFSSRLKVPSGFFSLTQEEEEEEDPTIHPFLVLLLLFFILSSSLCKKMRKSDDVASNFCAFSHLQTVKKNVFLLQVFKMVKKKILILIC